MSDQDPAELRLTLRVQPVKLASGKLWPWNARKRRFLKNLLRSWGFVVIEHTETPRPEYSRPSESDPY